MVFRFRFFRFLLFFLLVVVFLSVCFCTVAQVDTSILTMQGKDWQIKIDQQLQTETVTTNPYAIVTKQGQEKELFLQINSLEECASGIIEFKMDISGLIFYKQLPLDRELVLGEEYDFINATHAMSKGKVVVYRPENVVNSFAGFDVDGKKQLHIYASKIIDAKGQEIWLDSDLIQGLLVVYLPDQKTLESLTFPLLLDPTFGLTSNGGSSTNNQKDVLWATEYTLTEDGTVYRAYFLCGGSTLYNTSMGIYSMSGGLPNALLWQGWNASLNGNWVIYNVPDLELPAGDYALAVLLSDNGLYYYYDSATGDSFYRASTFPTMVDPFGTCTNSTRRLSLYAEYTQGISPTPTPTPTPTATPTATPTPTPIPTQEIDNLDYLIFAVEVFMFIACVVVMLWIRSVPLVGYLVGLFAIMVGMYAVLSGVYAVSFVFGIFTLFITLFGLVTVLMVMFGVRLRR